MAAPVPVSKGTASFINGTGDATPGYMASIATGDIIFLLAFATFASGGSPGNILVPSGFERVASATFRNSGGLSRGRASLFWMRAAGGESGTVTVVWSSSNKGTNPLLAAQLYRITGAPASELPWESLLVAGEDASGVGNATLTWPAITVGGTERTLLAFMGQGDDVPGAATPTGYAATLAIDVVDGAQDGQLVVFDKQNTASDGQITAANGEANGWCGFHLSLHATVQSAWSLLETARVLGSNSIDAAGTTVGVSPTQTIPAGRILAVRCVSDNVSTTAGQTNDHSLADDVGGHVYTKLREHTQTSGVAGDGVTISLWILKVVTDITTAKTVTLTVGSSTAVKAISLDMLRVPAGKTFQVLGGAGAAGSGTTPSVTLSGLADAEHLWLGAVGIERPLTDGFSNDCPDFTGGSDVGSSLTGSAAVRCNGGYLARKSTSETYNPVSSVSGDWAVVLAAVDAVAVTATEVILGVASMTCIGQAVALDRKLHLAAASLPVMGQALIPQPQIFVTRALMEVLGKIAAIGGPVDLGQDLSPALQSWALDVIAADLEDIDAAAMEAGGQACLIDVKLHLAVASMPVTGQQIVIVLAVGPVDVTRALMPVTGPSFAIQHAVVISRALLGVDGQVVQPIDTVTPHQLDRWRWQKIHLS